MAARISVAGRAVQVVGGIALVIAIMIVLVLFPQGRDTIHFAVEPFLWKLSGALALIGILCFLIANRMRVSDDAPKIT